MATETSAEQNISALARGDAPVLETLVQSFGRSSVRLERQPG